MTTNQLIELTKETTFEREVAPFSSTENYQKYSDDIIKILSSTLSNPNLEESEKVVKPNWYKKEETNEYVFEDPFTSIDFTFSTEQKYVYDAIKYKKVDTSRYEKNLFEGVIDKYWDTFGKEKLIQRKIYSGELVFEMPKFDNQSIYDQKFINILSTRLLDTPKVKPKPYIEKYIV